MTRYKRLFIDSEAYESMVNAMNATPKVETCGILIGDSSKDKTALRGRKSIQISNISEQPKESDFVMDPQELMDALKETTFINKKSDNDWVCIWHTHPSGIPIPSKTDLDRAEYNVIYIIKGTCVEPFYNTNMQLDNLVRAYGYDKVKEEFYKVELTEV